MKHYKYYKYYERDFVKIILKYFWCTPIYFKQISKFLHYRNSIFYFQILIATQNLHRHIFNTSFIQSMQISMILTIDNIFEYLHYQYSTQPQFDQIKQFMFRNANQPKVKPQTKYFYGLKRQNCLDETNNTFDPQNIMHEIFPSSNAKVSAQIQKFELMFGDVLYLNSKYQPCKQINPLFKYLMYRQVMFDIIHQEFKVTGYSINLINEQKNQIDRDNVDKNEAVTDLIEQIVDQLGKVKFEGKRERKNKLQQFNIKAKQQAQIYIKQYIEAMKKTTTVKKVLSQSQNYVRKQFQIIDSIQLLRPLDQVRKLQVFCKKYEKYFATLINIETRYRPYIYSIKISRPSHQSQSVLIKLSNLVELRQQQKNNKSQFIEMMQDLFEQLKKYYLDTSIFQDSRPITNQYFQFLSPQTVIFDQIALRPKLSYQPLIQDVFGLRKKPCSLECKIAMFYTPKQFDYFQSEEQLLQDQEGLNKKILLEDPFYGNVEMYRKLTTDQKKKINVQRQKLQKIKESILVDRFLLTSYYSVNKKKFGLPRLTKSYKQLTQQFKKQLSKKKQQIKQNIDILGKEFFGKSSDEDNDGITRKIRFNNEDKKQFNFKFTDLIDYFTVNQEDSFVNKNKYASLLGFYNVKYYLIQSIIKYLTSSLYFHKIINAKRYIILSLILGIQYFQELKTILTIQNQKYQEMQEMKFYLDNNGKKMKNKKSVQNSIQSTYKKIEEYKKNKEGSGFKFLNEESIGTNLFKYVTEFKDEALNQKNRVQKLFESIKSPQKKANYKSNTKEIIKDIVKKLQTDINRYKTILWQFTYPQVQLKYMNTPHKIDKKEDQTQYRLTSRKFLITVYAFMTCTKRNFINYDTFVLPFLKTDDYQSEQVKKLPTYRPQQQKWLFEIDTIVDYTKNIPKKMQYLSLYNQVPFSKEENVSMKADKQQDRRVLEYSKGQFSFE